MLYDRFKNEAEFRDQFIRPLLTRMGFFSVAHLHGSQEFGKDFVFSELNRFGLIKHNAAQVKHEEKIAQTQGGKITELVEQIQQAFAVPYKLPDSPRERYPSAVYVFNSGSITDGAKEHLSRELARKGFGDNVHVFDGERLDWINRHTAHRQEETIRPLLLGLRGQLLLNIMVWESILEALPAFSEARGPILAAIESYLSNPILTDRISLNEIGHIWQEARIIDRITSRYLQGANASPEVRGRDVQNTRTLCISAIERSRTVLASLDLCDEVFKPL